MAADEMPSNWRFALRFYALENRNRMPRPARFRPFFAKSSRVRTQHQTVISQVQPRGRFPDRLSAEKKFCGLGSLSLSRACLLRCEFFLFCSEFLVLGVDLRIYVGLLGCDGVIMIFLSSVDSVLFVGLGGLEILVVLR